MELQFFSSWQQTGWVFKFLCMIYEKHYLKRKTAFLNKWHFLENKRDYATCHKDAVNFLAA
jgi:hypothetical protein